LPEREAVAMLPPDAAGAPAAPAGNALRALDPEEVKLLIKQGEQFVATGDLVTARTVLQRAAQAGDATAAVALGATYDPTVLTRLGVMGMGGADVEQARRWYQQAENLGSAEATKQLRVLAGR
jgi:TPR repeat protein